MSTELLKNTQGIRGFQHQNFEFSENFLIWRIKRTEIRCPQCGSTDVSADFLRTRRVQALPCGNRQTYLEFAVHRVYCPHCRDRLVEKFHFLESPKSRITKALSKSIIADRAEMSIQAVAAKYRIRWDLVKDIEKEYLEKKYKKIQTENVEGVGIDEIHTGTNRDGTQRYLTIVRDLDTGNVVHIGDGKGVSALNGALKKLKKSKLKVVTMDMANAYSSWIQKYFPKVRIVFDHFHVIKLMNDKLDKFRRRFVSQLDESYRSQFKRLRWLFLKNHEDIDFDGKMVLKNIREQFKELSDCYLLKESLRSIYATAKNALDARAAFRRWATMAEETGITELRSMAATIREKLNGIITFWTYRHLSNASTEGFNNKIRWLMRKAYGFRDYVYLKLKIFQLPSLRTQKEL